MSLEQKKANVTFDPSHQSPESLSEAIEDMGFDSSLPELSPGTPVLAETQVITSSATKPVVQLEDIDKLSHTTLLLDVRERLAHSDLAVAFVSPPPISSQQQAEMVDVIVPLKNDLSRSPSPKDPSLSPCHKLKGGVSLLKLSVEGLTCHSCVTTIEGKIGKLNGIEKIKGAFLECFTDC